MKKLLLATAVTLAMSAGAMADTVSNLGINPTSGAGAFSNVDPGSVLLPAISPALGGSGQISLGGLFADTYNFTLVGDQILTIAFATNTYAGGDPQFITGFTGTVFDTGANNAPGGGDDFPVLGPELAAACQNVPLCQIFGGSATLAGGTYYLLITGNAAVDAGYGGNLSTFAAAETPLPAAVWLFGSAIGGGAFMLRRRKNKQSEPLAA